MGERFVAEDLAGKRLEIFLEYEDASVTRRPHLRRPITCAVDVRCALGFMFVENPAVPAEAIRVRLPELEKARRTQLEIGGGRSRADRSVSITVAIGNVRKAYGNNSVLMAADKAEPRHVLVQRV